MYTLVLYFTSKLPQATSMEENFGFYFGVVELFPPVFSQDIRFNVGSGTVLLRSI